MPTWASYIRTLFGLGGREFLKMYLSDFGGFQNRASYTVDTASSWVTRVIQAGNLSCLAWSFGTTKEICHILDQLQSPILKCYLDFWIMLNSWLAIDRWHNNLKYPELALLHFMWIAIPVIYTALECRFQSGSDWNLTEISNQIGS